MADARLKKEMIDCKRNEKLSGVSAYPVVPGNLRHLLGTIKGPTDTVYEGGIFGVDIMIPDKYPFEPPKMRFHTRIWHPNVSSQTGAICLDILKDQWSPALTIKTALVSLQALLSAPEPTDPQDAEVATQYLKEHEEYEKKAREWTAVHANPDGDVEKIKNLMGMGFPEAAARDALAATGGDENGAVEKLLSGA